MRPPNTRMVRTYIAVLVAIIVCHLCLVSGESPTSAALASQRVRRAEAGLENPNQPQCAELTQIKNGIITYRNATLTLPLLATFSCALGTELVGAETSACRRSGQWSHAQPKCVSIGLRAYPSRSGVSSVGLVSLHSEPIIVGLGESAQRAHGAVGFQIRLQGKHTAFLLKEHPSIERLIPSPAHNVYIFGPDGTLKRHVGMKVSRRARLRPIDFANDSSVLKGIKNAALAKRATNDGVIGFTIARGHTFRASLLGWSGLPLRVSKSRHAFIFRAEVEDQVIERGCFNGSPRSGRSVFKSNTPLPPATTIKSARLVCASIAREKAHRFFAISGRNCTSGNTFYGKYGKAAPHDAAGKPAYSCAMSAATARRLNISIHDAPLLIGAGAQKGFHHTFELSKSINKVPIVLNGGFEDDGALTPLHSPSTPRSGSQSVQLLAGQPLTGWRVSDDGHIGLATYGSDQLVGHTAFEGEQVLYVENEGTITQTLTGLRPGKSYTLRFAETIRKGQAAGLTLSVRLGQQYAIYQNPFVSIPLWTKRRVHFKASNASMDLIFSVSSSSLPGADLFFRPAATLLLDGISVSRRSFAGVADGSVGRANHGRVGAFGLENAQLLDAFKLAANKTAQHGAGGIGIRVQHGAAVIIGQNDLDTMVRQVGSVVYLNNGTTLPDWTTRTHSGFMQLRQPLIMRAIGHIARRFSNSVGFSVRTDQRLGVEVLVLSSSAVPLEKNPAYSTFFFDSGITDLGCWATTPNTRILSTTHAIKGKVNKQTCAAAAAKFEHDFFALHSPLGVATCVTGRSDIADKTDDIYYAGGRSSGCNTRCSSGRGNCGGSSAANVFRMPLYARVSRNGHSSTHPLTLAAKAHRAAQDVFDHPGRAYFSSLSPADERNLANLAAAESGAQLLGFEPILNNASELIWSHPLQYHFGGGQEYAVVRYVIQAPALTQHHPMTPSAWTFEGSKDGITWITLDTQSHIAFYTGQKRTFDIRNTQAFHFHRLVVTDNGGAGVPGFGVEGVTLFARRDRVRFLKALYRFEDASNIGWDSSFMNNDLQVLGGVINGTISNLLSEFNVTEADAKIGKASLKISNSAGSLPSYLALNTELDVPVGVPIHDRSFGIAFWFLVNSSIDSVEKFAGPNADLRPEQYSILSWGDSHGAASSNVIALDADFHAIRNSFGVADSTGLPTANGKSDDEESTHTLEDKWHHYAVSYDAMSGVHRVWVDTVLVASRFYQNPSFSVTPEHFLIGARSLPTETGVATSDEFNGMLDDLAIFNGPLSTSVVKEISTGIFTSYMPLTCQGMSDEFGCEAGITWGRATNAIKERYLRNQCYTKPRSCQTLSDQYGMSPLSVGRAGYYARMQFANSKCATWPSILIKRNTFASCPANQTITHYNIFSRESAMAACNLQGLQCQAFVWGDKVGNATHGIKPFELRLCATYLSELRYAPGMHITTRVSKYLLHPDSKMKCDAHDLPTHEAVPTSIHARWLCDATPGCVGYVWSGLIGAHTTAGRAATPGRLVLCASMRKSGIYPFPASGYEVGEKLGAYIVMSDRRANCSEVSVIGTIANVTSSLQARRECDRADGQGSAPKCVSYTWDKAHHEAHLCAGVPQTSVVFTEDTELGFVMPTSCQQMSDLWDITYGRTWGFAPFEVKEMFHSQNCTTTPRSCQALSDEYKLSPDVTSDVASEVPGEVRDLWLRQHCRTFPRIIESQYFVQATYADLQEQVDALKKKIDEVDARIAATANNPALTLEDKKMLRSNLDQAKAIVQAQLDDVKTHQEAELSPILQRAADSDATLDQTKKIHQILSGLLANSLRRTVV